MQYTSLTPDKILNSLVYRTLFYVNMYGSYKLSKNSLVFLAHPVDCVTLTAASAVYPNNEGNHSILSV